MIQPLDSLRQNDALQCHAEGEGIFLDCCAGNAELHVIVPADGTSGNQLGAAVEGVGAHDVDVRDHNGFQRSTAVEGIHAHGGDRLRNLRGNQICQPPEGAIADAGDGFADDQLLDGFPLGIPGSAANIIVGDWAAAGNDQGAIGSDLPAHGAVLRHYRIGGNGFSDGRLGGFRLGGNGLRNLRLLGLGKVRGLRGIVGRAHGMGGIEFRRIVVVAADMIREAGITFQEIGIR